MQTRHDMEDIADLPSRLPPAERTLAHMLSPAALHPRNVRRNLHYNRTADAWPSPLTLYRRALLAGGARKGHSPWAKLDRRTREGFAQ